MKNILFCGTPEFAINSLLTIYNHQNHYGYNLVGVVTIKDKISGRGNKINESEVKKVAQKLKLKVFQPELIHDPSFIDKIKKLNLDIIFVVAFKKLPRIFFEIPKLGTVNLHASLLPNYRGAAPINWAIINGENQTGLTTFFINENIDSGKIILKHSIKIEEDWHFDDLNKKLMNESNYIVKKTLKKLIDGNYNAINQPEKLDSSYQNARKLVKSDYKLTSELWNEKKLIRLFNYIRGISKPGIRMTIKIFDDNSEQQKNIIITRVSNYIFFSKAKITENQFLVNKNNIYITNGQEQFKIEKIKIENKKEMATFDFFNGYLKSKGDNKKISIII